MSNESNDKRKNAKKARMRAKRREENPTLMGWEREFPMAGEWGLGASIFDKLAAEAKKQSGALTTSLTKVATSQVQKSTAGATTAAKDVADKGIATAKDVADRGLIAAKDVSEKALVLLNKGLDIGKIVAMGLGCLAVLVILYKFYARSKTKTLNANVAYLELKGQ